MCAPKMPEPPDPYETAGAQTGTNISTAIANSILGNVNQITPYGNLTYTQSGNQFIEDANGQTYYRGPDGQIVSSLPAGLTGTGTATQVGAPAEENNYRGFQSERDWLFGDNYGSSNTADAGGGVVAAAGGGLPDGWTEIAGYYIPETTVEQTLSPEQQAIFDQTNEAKLNLATLANERSAFLQDYLGQSIDTSNLPGLVGNAGLNSNFSGNIGGGYDTAFSRNIGNGYNTIFGQRLGPNYSSDFARNIGGSYSDRLGPGYQTGVDLAMGYSGSDDFSADRQRYEDALWSRGADDRARTEETLRTRLLNSGIREGSAAWNSEMSRMNRQNEDARLATYLAAGDEQARMVNLARDAAIFGNQSALSQAQFGNDALSNQFILQNAASALQAQFASQQQQAANAAEMGLATFNRDTQQAQNAAALAKAQFGSAQQQAQNAAALSQAQFGSQQQQAANAALLADAQFQNNARNQGLQELYAERAQPLNEVIGLMSGTQIQNPNFVNTNQPTIPTVDMAGLINENYNQQLGVWQQEQAGLGGLLGGVGSLAGGIIGLSDDKAKKDKKRLGDVEDEMGLWEFRYKGEPKSQPKHIGLMASEVEKVKPSAIKKGKDGLRRVDYGKALGLMGAK